MFASAHAEESGPSSIMMYLLVFLLLSYTEQKYKCSTFVFDPIFHELNAEILKILFIHQKTRYSQIFFTDLFKYVFVSTFPLSR